MEARKNHRSKVTIIVPHYNQKECLKTLLPSIADQTFEDYEVIIIDDCSPDKSAVEYIRDFIKDRKNMSLLENTENMGFVRTCNKGIKLACGGYICLLNQDTVVKSSFAERNVAIMDADPSIGALSCIIVDKDGNNWSSGGSFRAGFPVILRDDFEGVRSVDYIAGTGPFYRREVFDKIGLLDEHYVMYHEDVEFGLRMRARTEYKACVFSERLVKHYVVPSIPTSAFQYYIGRNNILLARGYSPRHIPRVLVGNLRQAANFLLVAVLKRDLKYLPLSYQTVRGTLEGAVTRAKGG
jgi:GT2 family glycosyltransferase